MTKNILILLLRYIFENGPMEILINQGYTYSQIVLLLNEIQTNGYCELSEDGKLVLTAKGISTLSERYDVRKPSGAAEWIKPQMKYRVPPVGKYDIILPKKV